MGLEDGDEFFIYWISVTKKTSIDVFFRSFGGPGGFEPPFIPLILGLPRQKLA